MADKKKEQIEEYIGVGRRKTAVASVRLRPGTGNVNVNGREMPRYFPLQVQREAILAPFAKLEGNNTYDIIIRVKGGGLEGQVMASRLGIARALVKQHEQLYSEFKEIGFLTRDSRKKERKKYGLAGARKAFQFSKR